MIKTTLKSVAIALAILAAVMLTLTLVEGVHNVTAIAKSTRIRVSVVDLDGLPVHNAIVTVAEQCFYTDNRGSSPSIELIEIPNGYDDSITEWGTVTVKVEKEGFTPAFVFGCVVYRSDTRHVTVKLYPQDGSDLPYVSYVESPPDEYIKGLLDSD